MIDPAFRARVEAALAALAQEEGVRVLLAIESGSRAWGFPSRDSDYDVRFISMHPLSRYLSVAPLRDVIERPVTDTLDLSGWDVRKALQLMVRSNAVVLEWLSSPVTYRREPDAADDLLRLARLVAHLPALEYHYDRLARSAWHGGGEMPVRLKSYFYALRPALALRWLRRHGSPPPMDLPALLRGAALEEGTEEAIEALRQQKAKATEADTVPPQPALDALLRETLAPSVPRPAPWDQAAALAAADALFRRLLPP